MSFTKAAVELNVTPAAISQQVKLLEEYFAVQLFKRLTRAILLTGPGQSILPILSEGFDKLAQADDVLRSRRSEKILTVSVPPSFGAKWLLPRLDQFRQFAPEYEIRIDATDIKVDFNRENVDVALRYGNGQYPGLISECLITERIVPICSPKLLQGEHPLRNPSDLSFHTLLRSMRRFEIDATINWRMWLKAAGLDDNQADHGPVFNLDSMVLQAAIDQQGVALIDYNLAIQDIKRGLLIQPFAKELEQETNFCYYLVYPELHLEYLKVATFREWILNEIKQNY